MSDTRSPNIVVGVDSSDVSRDALSLAVREAEVRGGRVEVVTAWQLPDGVGALGPVPVEQWRLQAQQVQDRQVSAVIAGGSTAALISRQLIMGAAGTTLVHAARDADLLVVGSRRRRGVKRVLGSVSEYCARHSRVPVVVVPQSTAQPTSRAR